MELLKDAALVLGALWKLFGLWFVVTSLFFWKRVRPFRRHRPKTRFACVIPARNEAAVVDGLVRSLKAQNYPGELFDIYVAPNNCTDRTEEAAREAGAHILHPVGPVRCKGDVLHQAFARLLPMDYDAFLIFDADNVASPDYLSRMNDAFCDGARAVKSAIRIKNPYDSWVSACYSLYYGLADSVYNRSRAALGLSAKLVGTGFGMSRALLEELGGWNTETIAEDAEFAALLAERGERLWWVPEAVTYDEAPTDFGVSLTQRRRWCSGIMSAAEARMGALLRAAPPKGGVRVFDMMCFLSMPFYQALSPLPMLLLMLTAAGTGVLLQQLLGALLGGVLGLLGMVLFGGIIALLMGERDRRIWKGILTFPVFMASWLPLQILSLCRRTTGWKEIRHGAALTGALER